jgi:hypothetical protein
MAIPYGSEEDLIKFLDRIHEEGTSAKDSLDKRFSENIEIFRGNTWKGKTQPVFMDNTIAAAIEDKIGKLSESKPEIVVLPVIDGLGKSAELLTKVCSSIWDKSRLEYKTERLALFGILSGVAFVGTPYNPSLSNGNGDVDVVIKDPRSCGVDISVCAAEDAGAGEYMFMEDFIPLDVIRSEYPGRGALVKPSEKISGYDTKGEVGTGAKIRSAFSRLARGKEPEKRSAIPKAIIQEYFIQDRRASIEDLGVVPMVENLTKHAGDKGIPFPGGRRIIRAGNVILEDTYNPYWDGGWPLDMMSWKLDVESAWGPDEVQGVKRMQETVNRLGDAYAKVACMNAVTRLIMDTGAVSPAERNKLTNEIGQIIEKAPGRAFEFTSPPLLSVDVVNFVATVKGWIRERLGAQQSPMQKDVPSIVTGPAIEGLQLSLETPVRTASRRVEELYSRIGQKFISRVFQYYTSNRLIHVIGPDARWQQFEFQRKAILQDDKGYPRSQEDMRKAWRDYNFCVSPGSSLAVTKTTRAMMYQQFAQLGWMHPRKVMEAVGIQNPNEEIKAAIEAREMGLIAGAETSNVPATLSKMKGALAA